MAGAHADRAGRDRRGERMAAAADLAPARRVGADRDHGRTAGSAARCFGSRKPAAASTAGRRPHQRTGRGHRHPRRANGIDGRRHHARPDLRRPHAVQRRDGRRRPLHGVPRARRRSGHGTAAGRADRATTSSPGPPCCSSPASPGCITWCSRAIAVAQPDDLDRRVGPFTGHRFPSRAARHR